MSRDGVVLCPLEPPRKNAREDLEVSLEQGKLPLVLDLGLGKEPNNQNGNLRWHLPRRGGGSRGGLECHLPILKNDFFKNHLESFPDCENGFCT